MKKLSYMIEATALWFAFAVFRVLGAETASNFGGWVGRAVGPRLATSRKARNNLARSFPDWDGPRLDAVIRGMWDNLGRVIAEYPHLETITMNNLVIEGGEHLEAIGEQSPLIVTGGHLANWELLPTVMNYRLSRPIVGVYREPNNPYVAAILERCRNFGNRGGYVPKSSTGTRALVREIHQGGRIGILIDQKYNEGIPVEFFGRKAMTSAAAAQLSRKYNAPVLPLRVIREKTRFRIVLEAPVLPEPALGSGGDESDEAVMLAANRRLERWIREYPEQWLWLHRRWDSKALQQLP